MPWPTPQEYNEAIQNPRLNFADPELAAGTVETTALGLPRPITGNFASVYRLHCSGRDWAVRCFWREYADLQERYAAISRHLGTQALPYTVGFEYLPQGIRVQGSWYPILKMEWVEGELLGRFIERHVGDVAALNALADRWRAMIAALEAAGIAHGDLQHGNVLVVHDALRLVDYDALYVPELRGRGSHELGHQHYQHPGRTERDFGPGLDRFSALVVECSVRAVARQPDLWTTLRAGDESLLFRRSDFIDPGSSPAFRLLRAQADAEVVRLTAMVEQALNATPLTVPAIFPEGARSGPAPRGPRGLSGQVLGAIFPGVPAVDRPTTVSGNAPGWLIDHLSTPAHPRPSPRIRACAAVAGVLSGAWVVGGFLVGYSPVVDVGGAVGGVGGAGLILLAAFHGEGEVRAMKLKLREERRRRRALRALEHEIDRYERRKVALQARYGRAERRLEDRLGRMCSREQQDRDLASGVLREREERTEELKRQLRQAEKNEIQEALEEVQRRHIRAQLRRRSIQSAPLSVQHKVRLRLLGVHSAAGVNAQRMAAIRRLGEDVAESVAAWRVDAELAARKSAPAVLDAPQLHRLTERFAHERTRIERDHQQAVEHGVRLAESNAAYWAGRQRPVRERLARRSDTLQSHIDDLNVAIADVRRRMEPLKVQLARAQRDLEPYGGLSFGRYLADALTGRG